MPRKLDLKRLKTRSTNALNHIMARVESPPKGADHLFIRWMCAMSAVEIHGVWERYAENRLVALLNHDVRHFVSEQSIKGISHVSVGLAYYVVRGGNRYFDFRSMSDLISRADHCAGNAANPFRAIPVSQRNYLDALAAIRNYVVHGSDASIESYKRTLSSVYGITYAPGPDEFLNALDNRASSPARYKRRFDGLATVVRSAIAMA
ncbi:MAG: hypothetical protein P8Y71_07095 [Pseudolabrys sp.]|jgi:hypothetical protein